MTPEQKTRIKTPRFGKAIFNADDLPVEDIHWKGHSVEVFALNDDGNLCLASFNFIENKWGSITYGVDISPSFIAKWMYPPVEMVMAILQEKRKANSNK